MEDIPNTHPSKIFSYCPHCGSPKFLFNGVKKFVCQSCDFTYYLNAASAVAVILRSPDGRIVLTKRKFEPRAGYFDLPGGFVDTMERVEDAVKREISEELGIEITEMQFLASFPNEYVYKNISYFTSDLAFVCPVADLSRLTPSDDVADAVLIHPQDIDFNSISFSSIVNVLKTYTSTFKG